jgi:hypothetical protein
MRQPLQIDVGHDPDADVWVAQSRGIPGLVAEAPTLLALDDRLRQIIPDLVQPSDISVDPSRRWTYLVRKLA